MALPATCRASKRSERHVFCRRNDDACSPIRHLRSPPHFSLSRCCRLSEVLVAGTSRLSELSCYLIGQARAMHHGGIFGPNGTLTRDVYRSEESKSVSRCLESTMQIACANIGRERDLVSQAMRLACIALVANIETPVQTIFSSLGRKQCHAPCTPFSLVFYFQSSALPICTIASRPRSHSSEIQRNTMSTGSSHIDRSRR